MEDHIMNGDQPGMPQSGRRSRLRHETRNHLLMAFNRSRGINKLLECHRTLQEHVLGQPNRPHGALAELMNQPVPS
jgi:hypothetical protein